MKNKNLIPIFFIIFIVFILALTNIKSGTYFTGWDNLHPEFNLSQYAKRVIFGAWVEHQGTGAPAAQSQLSEVSRLPIIFILNLLLPKNLVRYIFHFLMLFVGAVGIFFYLKKYWLHQLDDKIKNWLALFGSFYYILNIFTLHQFYISFELFIVQFAFLPFVLISIHDLLIFKNNKTLFKFIIIQLLIASSAHTPTVFYLSLIFFLIYSFFVSLEIKKNLLQSLKTTFSLLLLMFFIHAYWIFPNLYYLLKNSHYVTESSANQLFNQESKWSIIESGDIEHLISGIHYLFTWKDFNFKKFNYEYIFSEWINHFSNPFILFLLILFNLLSFFGALYIFFMPKKSLYKFSILIVYFFSLSLIWLGLFLPPNIIKLIYKFEQIKEAFRNPFTKLQIIYSFTTTLLVCTTLENIISQFKKSKKTIMKFLVWILMFSSFISLFYVYSPSFSGQFINEKLRTGIPSEYFEMYRFLNSKNPNIRVLELPFLANNGWVIYNWNFNKEISGYKGYQGIGFNFFGLNHPYLTSDFARWTETTDFFFDELIYGLNLKNSFLLKETLKKYKVGYIIIDENIIANNNRKYDYQKLHSLIKNTGAIKIWQKKSLSIYEFPHENDFPLIIPKKITFINKNNTKRVKRDIVFEKLGDYIERKEGANILFPFADLYSSFLNNIDISDTHTLIKRTIHSDDYILDLTRINKMILNETIPYKIEYKNNRVNFWFPKIKLIANDETEVLLPSINNFSLEIKQHYDALMLKNNNEELLIKKDSSIYGQINKITNLQFQIIGINYDPQDASIFYPDKNIIKIKPAIDFGSENLKDAILINGLKEIKIEQEFPNILTNLKKQPSENCSNPQTGSIKTDYKFNNAIYTAKDYGVNCNSLPKEYLESNQFYILQIEGNNYLGRSLKFFLNYSDPNTLMEDFIMPEGKFKKFKTVLPVNNEGGKNFLTLNWETRSFGKTSINELKKINISIFPIDIVANISLKKNSNFTNYQINDQTNNNLSVENFNAIYNFIYFANIKCLNNCFIGINEAFDNLWLAVDNKFNILPHYKLNGWANIWTVNNYANTVIIVYVPEIISLLLMITLFFYLLSKISSLITAKN